MTAAHHAAGEAASLYSKLVTAVVQGVEKLGPALENMEVSKQIAWAAQDTLDFSREIEDEFGLLSSVQVGELLGSESSNPRSLAQDAHKAGRVLALRRGRRSLYPGFQFVEHRILPGIKDVKVIGQEHGWSDRDLVFWLCAPTGYLGDRRPVDLLADDPERVVAAARQAFAVVW